MIFIWLTLKTNKRITEWQKSLFSRKLHKKLYEYFQFINILFSHYFVLVQESAPIDISHYSKYILLNSSLRLNIAWSPHFRFVDGYHRLLLWEQDKSQCRLWLRNNYTKHSSSIVMITCSIKIPRTFTFPRGDRQMFVFSSFQ